MAATDQIEDAAARMRELAASETVKRLVLQRRLGGIEEDGILDRPALGVRLLGRRIARLGVMQPAQ